jgi:oligoendopeptidase F
MHSYHTWKTQPYIYSDYSTFVAEVASNFNQALVRAHLLRTRTEPEFQIAILEEAMSNFHRYFFLMPALARFEFSLHETVERGDGLNAESMMELMAGIFREGYGDGVEIDAERVGITWAEFPVHMYLNFYVFQYATGISAAHALADRVLAGGRPAAEKYLAFLSAGSSVEPIELLKRTGVDMTSPEPAEKAFRVLDGYVSRLEKLIDGRSPGA